MEDLELCEQGGVAGPSRSELDDLLLQLFSTDVSVGAVFVTAFPTTAERASCKAHKSLCTGWLDPRHLNIYCSGDGGRACFCE